MPFLFNGNNTPASFLYRANIIMDFLEQHVVFRYIKYYESKTLACKPRLADGSQFAHWEVGVGL